MYKSRPSCGLHLWPGERGSVGWITVQRAVRVTDAIISKDVGILVENRALPHARSSWTRWNGWGRSTGRPGPPFAIHLVCSRRCPPSRHSGSWIRVAPAQTFTRGWVGRLRRSGAEAPPLQRRSASVGAHGELGQVARTREGEDFNGAHVLGPWLITAGRIGNSYALAIRTTMNGRNWTTGSTGDQRWSFEQLPRRARLACPSLDRARVQVGNAASTGGRSIGHGKRRQRGRGGETLRAGDVVELTADRLGTLTNTMATRLTVGTSDAGTREPARRSSRLTRAVRARRGVGVAVAATTRTGRRRSASRSRATD